MTFAHSVGAAKKWALRGGSWGCSRPPGQEVAELRPESKASCSATYQLCELGA